MFNIEQELRNLPEQPGVYIMKDQFGNIIYIGKAVNLKKRVSQYFQNKNQTLKVKSMVKNISEFEYIITDSELEALILECNLIKKHRPKYNVLLKDDKHYPYIKVTMNEDYPKILITRKIEKDGARYFGPYTSSFYVRNTIDTIKKIFPVRSCNKVLPTKRKDRPCLNYYIKRCLAPCQGNVDSEEYKNIMNEICLFLEGKHQELIKNLEKKMLECSEKLDFEQAAKLRDKINSIKHISEKQKIISPAMQDQDVIAFASDDKNTVVQVFFIRGGKLLGQEKFALEGTENTSRQQIIYEFLKQFYLMTDYIPKEILLQEEIEEINIIEKWLSDKKGSKVYIRVPKKGEKHNLIDMVYKNAVQALKSFFDKESDAQDALKDLQDLLNLKKLPTRIEAYDISNIQGSLSVGSMVTFINGIPDKSQYRRFKIKSVEGPNDYKSIQEVLFRRFNNETLDIPNLICIDGGKGHVNAALKVIGEKNIPVCGLVKDSKHKTRGIIYDNKEYNLRNNSKLLSFIAKIQDEVHRFAIKYHKRLREKEFGDSILDKIEGIGRMRKTELLKYFKSIENIKKASIEELSKVKGMNKSAAEKVYNYFHESLGEKE